MRGQAGEASAGAGPVRVLIVEDDFLVALGAEAALLDHGYAVVGMAATAEEAVRLAEDERPDLVLMDIRLAGLRDGIDAAGEIRRRLAIPVLFASAHADTATRRRGEAAAAPLGWLLKPYGAEELAAAVAAAWAEARRRAGA